MIVALLAITITAWVLYSRSVHGTLLDTTIDQTRLTCISVGWCLFGAGVLLAVSNTVSKHGHTTHTVRRGHITSTINTGTTGMTGMADMLFWNGLLLAIFGHTLSSDNVLSQCIAWTVILAVAIIVLGAIFWYTRKYFGYLDNLYHT